MSIGESRVASTQRAIQINADVIEFLRNGGEIQEIPIGKSAQNLEVRAAEGAGTRLAWADENQHMKSKAGKLKTIKKVKEKKYRKAQASAQAVANKARARERRARLMPRVLELKSQGKSHREIAAIIDVTHGTINNWVREEMSNEPG